MITLKNTIPKIRLGVLSAQSVDVQTYPPDFDAMLAELLQQRKNPLSPEEDGIRKAARDMLRNASYKPTGRGKPASEYLLRSATKEEFVFPRINSPVDINNYISLKYLLPISTWDIDLAGTIEFACRLGQPEENYIFNQTGQTIKLKDLVLISALEEGEDPRPIANPIKDSMATKIQPTTQKVGVAIYAPADLFSPSQVEEICAEFGEFLNQCGPKAQAKWAVAEPGENVEL